MGHCSEKVQNLLIREVLLLMMACLYSKSGSREVLLLMMASLHLWGEW
jgi:hypothetical protein